jgi:DNA-binding SARP family transcriptional activator/Tfp pilus assembly protein PilF
MEFRLLGPVEVRIGGQRVDAGHTKQRCVLAVLLLELGAMVPVGQLIDRVWGDHPPASVRNNLYAYVARLRTVLSDGCCPDVRLIHRPGGYLMEADTERVDVYRFRRQVSAATAAATADGGDAEAARLLRAALGLWRGQALAGLESPWLRAMRETLELQRVGAVLDLGDIALRQGQFGPLIDELATEVATRPTDERMIGQLMVALYRSGRQAEALRWFEQTRKHLAEELGANPGPELRALHERMLRDDLPRTAPAAAHQGVPVPQELPPDVPAFTGRFAELAELDRLLVRSGTGISSGTRAGASATAVISAVSGTAGVGKTALATHWAHRAARHFPDGQLYVNLRGYDPGQPIMAAEALAGFLRALGLPGEDIPADPAERAARYRSLISGKRILMLLDNASEVEQVRPLLPGTATCAALITSRDSLAGLVARDGARRIELDVLPVDETIDLLRALIGPRVDADLANAIKLATRCARLPLALRVAAELAVARPAISLAALADELGGGHRLDLLDASGDPRTAVRAVLSWSYRHLDAAAATTFRRFGLHPGPDLDVYAMAALTDTGTEEARELLERLARTHLVQPVPRDRYGMHDLLRAYTRELADVQDSEEERRLALTRLFDYCLDRAAAAMDTLYPADRQYRPRVSLPAFPAPQVTDPIAARAWLDAERATLVAIATQTASGGWPDHAKLLAGMLFRYLDSGGHHLEATIIYTSALQAARYAGDRRGEVVALNGLGHVAWRSGLHDQAADHYRQTLELNREAGDRNGEASALGNLAVVAWRQGRYQQAAGHYRQALALFRTTGDRAGESRTLSNLGMVDERQGRYEQAAGNYRQALALQREIGDRAGEARALNNLGAVDVRQGRYQQAADHLREALVLFHGIGDKNGEAHVLADLGVGAARQGSWQRATDHLEQALAIFRETTERSGQAEALNNLGEISIAAGDASRARTQYAAALDLARQNGDKYEEARADGGLARAYRAIGDTGQARHHWQEALTIFTELGVPEAGEARSGLDQLGADGG